MPTLNANNKRRRNHLFFNRPARRSRRLCFSSLATSAHPPETRPLKMTVASSDAAKYNILFPRVWDFPHSTCRSAEVLLRHRETEIDCRETRVQETDRIFLPTSLGPKFRRRENRNQARSDADSTNITIARASDCRHRVFVANYSRVLARKRSILRVAVTFAFII